VGDVLNDEAEGSKGRKLNLTMAHSSMTTVFRGNAWKSSGDTATPQSQEGYNKILQYKELDMKGKWSL
jgi:hypothetical protein